MLSLFSLIQFIGNDNYTKQRQNSQRKKGEKREKNNNNANHMTKGPFPLRAWKRAFFVSFIDLRLKRAVKIEASAKKNQ